jgi:hypothetical protein
MSSLRLVAWISAVVLALSPLAPPAAALRCRPTSRFVVLPDGLVRDTLTKLVRQQEVSPTTMSWADAKAYGSSAGSGLLWPTVQEPESLLDLDESYPDALIEGTAFPGTPTSACWSSSPYAAPSGQAWFVDFSEGFSDFLSVGVPFRVRCVR